VALRTVKLSKQERSLTGWNTENFFKKYKKSVGLRMAFVENDYFCGKVCRTNGTAGFHKDVFACEHSYGCE
jgi:hypothetical protein